MLAELQPCTRYSIRPPECVEGEGFLIINVGLIKKGYMIYWSEHGTGLIADQDLGFEPEELSRLY